MFADLSNKKKSIRIKKMKLVDYLSENGIKKNHFAAMAGTSLATILHAISGHDIKLSTAIGIIKASKGNVKIADLDQTLSERELTKPKKLRKQPRKVSQKTKESAK